MPHMKVSLVPDIFSSAVDRNWHFNKVSRVEMHKWGESGFFRKLSAQKSDRGKSTVIGNMIHMRITQNCYKLDNYDILLHELSKKVHVTLIEIFHNSNENGFLHIFHN
jgi:hypothetical protein